MLNECRSSRIMRTHAFAYLKKPAIDVIHEARVFYTHIYMYRGRVYIYVRIYCEQTSHFQQEEMGCPRRRRWKKESAPVPYHGGQNIKKFSMR